MNLFKLLRRLRPVSVNIAEPDSTFELATPPATRLLHILELQRSGREAIAELELSNWRREENFPVEAQSLLCGIRAMRGDVDGALEAIDEDSIEKRTIELRVTLLVAADRIDEARDAAELLLLRHGHRPEVVQWLKMMNVPGLHLPGATVWADDCRKVDMLAGELAEHSHIIASLVVAQKLSGETERITLLRDALMRVPVDENDTKLRLTIIEGVAELSETLGESLTARTWAQRGLEIDPYYAPLALLKSRTDSAWDESRGSLDLLKATAEAHPTYRDVRAALIRREFAMGYFEPARARLAQWEKKEPTHPVVESLRLELAA